MLRGPRTSYRRFLFGWLLANVGSATLFSFYPLVTRSAFGLGAGASAWGFAAAAAGCPLLYGPAGQASRRWTAGRVYRLGLMLRLGAFAFLLAVAFLRPGSSAWWGALGVAVVAVALGYASLLLLGAGLVSAALVVMPLRLAAA